jgi:lipopolysaccharide export system permease protein
MARSLLQQRAPFGQVLILLVYAMPTFAALSFPFATLVSALMSMGRMNSDNEIMVMQASGISLKKVFLPFLLLGALFSVVSFSMNDYFMPLGTINFNKVYRRIMNATPSLVLKPYSVNKFQSTTIISGDVKGNRVEKIMIIDKGDGNTKQGHNGRCRGAREF